MREIFRTCSRALPTSANRILDCLFDVGHHTGSRTLLLLRCKSRRRLFGTRPAHNRVGRTRRGRFLIPYLVCSQFKLQYTEQVEQLGFTEAAAKEFSIGFYRGQVCIPIRHSGGSISGFVGYADGQMKLPPKWLPATSHVVTVSKVRKKSPARTRGLFFYFLMPAIDLGLLDPVMLRLWLAAIDVTAAQREGVLAGMIQNHPNRTSPDLG